MYNNSAKAIYLSGYYLSDDPKDLTKWTFPDLCIQGNSYYTVWADNGEEQGDNHAGFKLSASGEALYLIAPDLEIADHLVFGEQEEDTTWGRIPNGTGPFVEMRPPPSMWAILAKVSKLSS